MTRSSATLRARMLALIVVAGSALGLGASLGAADAAGVDDLSGASADLTSARERDAADPMERVERLPDDLRKPPVTPPTPSITASIPAGADGFLNAAEIGAVMVTGTYQNTSTQAITTILVRVASGPCSLDAPGSPTMTATLQPGGTWVAGPFDLSSSLFTEGAPVCAIAWTPGGTPLIAFSNTPVKDSIAPAVGTVAFEGSYADDGYLNIVEAALPDPDGRPVVWDGPGDATGAIGRFADAADVVIPGGACGPFALPPDGNTPATDGWLNAACLAAAGQGEIRWQVRWSDAAGNASAWASDSLVIDTIAPVASISLVDGDGKVTAPEATSGVDVSWEVTETGPPVVVAAAEGGQPSPASCVYGGQPRGPVTGTIQPACFAALADGPIEVSVSGTDAAGNPASALDASELDRVGPPAPIVTILTDPITSANVLAVDVKVEGEAGTEAQVRLSDADGTSVATTGVLSSAVTVQLDATTLDDGTVTASAVLVDADGNPSPPAFDTAAKDTTAPALGAVAFEGLYADDGYINAAEASLPDPAGRPVTWSGAADAVAAQGRFADASDAIITGGTCGPFDLAVSGSGTDGYLNSSCMAAAAAKDPQGEVRWQVRWRDAVGNWSGWASDSIVVDTKAPIITVTAPADGTAFAPGSTITMVGSTEPNASLAFTADLVPAGNGAAGGDGAFTHDFSGLADGPHTLGVSAADPAGNVGTAQRTILIDRNIPVIIKPDEGALTTGTVSVYGTGLPASRILLFEGDRLIGTGQVTTAGDWSIITGMPSGPHAIRARGVRPDGVISEWSNTRRFETDAAIPTVEITTGNLSVFPGTPTIAGRATDDRGVARIELRYYDPLGALVLTADAACPTCGPAAGSVDWTHEPALARPGLYTVRATAYDKAGNPSLSRQIIIADV